MNTSPTIVPYAGWSRCLRLAAAERELLITLDVGPRILRFSFAGGDNLFKEYPAMLGKAGEGEWMIRGGHRFWTAPEGPASYALDNDAVDYRIAPDGAVEIERALPEYGLHKLLRVHLADDGLVTVQHRLRNTGTAPAAAFPWALSVMAPGGRALIPQPPFVPHPSEQPPGTPVNMQDFLPNRRVVLWAYTRPDDPRFRWGESLWSVRQDPDRGATKFGLLHEGWAAYQLGDSVFCKWVHREPGAPYPDDGANFELFTNRDMLELETLGPAQPLASGAATTHTEYWRLVRHPAPLADDPAAAAAFFQSLPPVP